MNPSTGQFLSKDRYEGDTSNPITLHKYLYAHANPVTYEDPSGYFAVPKTVVVIAVIATLLTASMAPNMPALKMSSTMTSDWSRSLQLQHGLINIFDGMTELGSMFNEAIRAAEGKREIEDEKTSDAEKKEKSKKKSKQSGKEKADDAPSWAKNYEPEPGETAEEFTKDLMNDKYGKGKWKKGAGTEYSKIYKWAKRTLGLK